MIELESEEIACRYSELESEEIACRCSIDEKHFRFVLSTESELYAESAYTVTLPYENPVVKFTRESLYENEYPFFAKPREVSDSFKNYRLWLELGRPSIISDSYLIGALHADLYNATFIDLRDENEAKHIRTMLDLWDIYYKWDDLLEYKVLKFCEKNEGYKVRAERNAKNVLVLANDTIVRLTEKRNISRVDASKLVKDVGYFGYILYLSHVYKSVSGLIDAF